MQNERARKGGSNSGLIGAWTWSHFLVEVWGLTLVTKWFMVFRRVFRAVVMTSLVMLERMPRERRSRRVVC